MTVHPLNGSRVVTRPVGRGSRLARWAVRIAVVVAGVLVAAFVIFGIAFLIGGWTAIDDMWVGMVVVTALFGGLFASLAAFVAALTALIRRERWVPLWLPLLLFPAILTFLVIGELFWWE